MSGEVKTMKNKKRNYERVNIETVCFADEIVKTSGGGVEFTGDNDKDNMFQSVPKTSLSEQF